MQQEKQVTPDYYDWILSPEIRDYLRENHRFSFEEKIRLICGACRPLEEKYNALRALREESEGKEKVLAGELVRLHDWAFDQLRQETPGQVFVFMEELGCDTGERDTRYHGVDQMFRTYEELTAYIKDGHLEMISLTYWWIDVVSDWQTIDWLRHAEPAELPSGQEMLAEMCAYLRRLEQQNAYAAESAFYDIVDGNRSGREIRSREVYRTPEPIPFQELLEDAQEEEP